LGKRTEKVIVTAATCGTSPAAQLRVKVLGAFAKTEVQNTTEAAKIQCS